MIARGATGIGLVLVGTLVAASEPRALAAAWLAAWWWVFSLAVGGYVNLWIHTLTGGRWGAALGAPAREAARRLPWLALLALPWLAGAAMLYPWIGERAAWSAALVVPGFAQHWFSTPFFALRLVVYTLVFGLIVHPRTVQTRRGAAAALVLYLIGGTLFAADVLMTLGAHWTSAGFGLVVLAAQALGGTALAIVAGAAVRPAASRAGDPPLGRDLGNLLLMWTMLWAYLTFMQFLVIWAENLPREIVWLVPRIEGPWRWGGLALAALAFALPFGLLLSRARKDDPRRLRKVAAIVLAGTALDAAWTVLPSVVPSSGRAPVAMICIATGLALVLYGDLMFAAANGEEPLHAAR